MKADTRKALKKSISHWRRLKKDPLGYEGPYSPDCPLCSLFASDTCKGCPVQRATGAKDINGCEKYPSAWPMVARAWERLESAEVDSIEFFDAMDDWEYAAAFQIKFLQSLLPKEPKRAK